ncbi:MAG: DUF4388 domain-containing protein [Thermodesulfovibrionales bacterium]|nr:DUF4388 domain-containing protein [Thermodesulfovibrionales bacterium]
MKGIKGQLSSLPITDLMQWIEMNRKSGVLFLKRDESGRCICFKDGSILLASSTENGERFGDYITAEANIPGDKLREIVTGSRDKGNSFMRELTESKAVPIELMKAVVEHVVEAVLMDVLGWNEGSFHFVESLPKFVQDGGVSLNTSHTVFESVRKYDEALRQKNASGS